VFIVVFPLVFQVAKAQSPEFSRVSGLARNSSLTMKKLPDRSPGDGPHHHIDDGAVALRNAGRRRGQSRFGRLDGEVRFHVSRWNSRVMTTGECCHAAEKFVKHFVVHLVSFSQQKEIDHA
jgi:hypothetical protein